MSRSLPRADSTTIGHLRPAAQPVDDVEPVHPGQAEVEQHDVGVVAGGELQRLLPGLGQVDVVAPGLAGWPRIVRRIGASSSTTSTRVTARLPPGAAGSSTTIVVPPPGVSSIASSPPIASTKPRAMARPSPTPGAVGLVVDDALERLEHELAVGRPDARAVVDHPHVDAAAPADARRRPRRPAPATPAGA